MSNTQRKSITWMTATDPDDMFDVFYYIIIY